MRSILVLAWLWVYVIAAAQSDSPSWTSNEGYLEPGSCAECHRDVAESYSLSGMARSFGAVESNSPFPHLGGAAFRHAASEQLFTVYLLAGKPYLRRHQLGFDGSVTNVLDKSLDYWFGSGNHGRSYASRTKSGELVELPLTWYADKGGYWAMSPGYDRPDHAGFTRKITNRCIFCHTGSREVQATTASDFGIQVPALQAQGIDCQRCHGPGGAHVAAVRRGLSTEGVRSAIVNPARLSAVRQMELCMQCHLETTSLRLPATLQRHGRSVFSYRPGEPLENYILHFDRATSANPEDRFEFTSAAYRLRHSRCYLGSREALTCTTCHNPHERSNTSAAAGRYTKACQACHQPTVQKLIAEGRHSAARECVSCHMPKRRPSDAIHVMVTDHLIQKSPPVNQSPPLIERHDGNTSPYRGRVALYYPSTLENTAENRLCMAVAQVKQESNLAEGLRELEAAIARYKPERAEFYFELAEAYRHSGKLDKAIAYYEESCSREPLVWRHFHQLGTTLAAVGNLERALRELERARSLAPKEPAVLEAIGGVMSRLGRHHEAVSLAASALALDSESASAHSNLGARLLQLGDAKGAEREWREAVRLRPESALTHLNLANLLSTEGSFVESRYHFEAALKIAPSFADAHMAYALALERQSELNQAKEHYEEALRLNPQLLVARNSLANLLLKLGDRGKAIGQYRRALASSPNSASTHYKLALALEGETSAAEVERHLSEAVRLEPNFFEAHLKLGQILHARGELALAAQHLRKAAESPNLTIRSSANLLISK